MQAECGHLFCKGCLDTVLKRRRPICPLDKEEISQDGVRKMSENSFHLTCSYKYSVQVHSLVSTNIFADIPRQCLSEGD